MEKYNKIMQSYFYVLFLSIISLAQSAIDKVATDQVIKVEQGIGFGLLSEYTKENRVEYTKKLESFIRDFKSFCEHNINVQMAYCKAADIASGSHMEEGEEGVLSDALSEINDDFICITGKNKLKNPRKELNDNLLDEIVDHIVNYKSISTVCSDFRKNFEHYKDAFLTYALIKYYFYEKLSDPENIREYFLFKDKSKYNKILKQANDIIEHKSLEDFDMDFSTFQYMINKILNIKEFDPDDRIPIQIGNITEEFDNMIFENLKGQIFNNCWMGFFECHVPDDQRWRGPGCWEGSKLAEEDFAPIKEAENFDQIHTALIGIKKTKKCVWNVEFKNRLDLFIILYKIIFEKYGKKLEILNSKSSSSSSSG